MMRCCDGSTYVVPNGPGRCSPGTGQAEQIPQRMALGDPPSWAVLCVTCEAVLAVVDGPRDEVYADL